MLLLLLIYTTIQWTVIRAQHNLTPFGTASQSSRFIRSTPEGALLPPISNKFTLETCSTTNVDGALFAWWMFEIFFNSAFITDITIYYREGFGYRMNGFQLYVTNSSAIPPVGYLCYEDTDPGFPDITQTIPCNQLGKYVIYYDTIGDPDTRPVVELCYVAINGCQKGMWGTACSKSCSARCIGHHCHPKNGSCVWGCDEQKCLNNRWDILTGVCTEGCVRGLSQICNCHKCTYVS